MKKSRMLLGGVVAIAIIGTVLAFKVDHQFGAGLCTAPVGNPQVCLFADYYTTTDQGVPVLTAEPLIGNICPDFCPIAAKITIQE